MISTTIGDQFWAQMFKNQIGQTKIDLAKVTDELATGRHSDLASVQTSNLTLHAAMKSQAADLSAFSQVQKDATIFFDTVDFTLEKIQSVTGDLGQNILKTSQSITPNATERFTDLALQNLTVYNNDMQTTPLGLNQFGNLGNDLDLGDPASLVNRLLQQVTPLSNDAETAKNQVSNLVSQAYAPAAVGQPSFQISNTTTLSHQTNSADEGFKNAIAATVILAHAQTQTGENAKELARTAGELLLESEANFIQARARNSINQQITANSRVQNEAARASIETTLSEIETVDIAERATQLKQLESQLEKVYLLTARINNLSLSDYL